MSKNQLLIAGIDYWHQLERGMITIDRQLTHVADQCRFSLIDHKPAEGEEVIVRHADQGILFGGVVVKSVLAKRSADGRKPIYDVDCDDYTTILDGKLVVETYTDMSASDIFLDIVDKYITGFTTSGVVMGAPVIENTGQDLAYVRPSEAFKYLCDYVGWEWEPTYTKDLRFFRAEDLHTPAPMELVDGAQFELGKHTVDVNGLRNRVYVLGGTLLSDPQEVAWLADGVARTWVLPWGPHEIRLYVFGFLQSVGIENIHDENNFDFMMSFTEKYIRCSHHTPTPHAGAQISLIARQDVPVVTVFEDLTSQAAVAAIQGGDGVYEHVIIDPQLVTVQAAEAVGQADLGLHANPRVSGDFTTATHGWYPGQIVRIDLPHRGIADTAFMVQRAKLSRIGGDPTPDRVRWIYQVTYGGRLLGLADFLRSLVSRQQRDRGEETNIIQKMVFSDDQIPIKDDAEITPDLLPFRYTEPRSTWGRVVLWSLPTVGGLSVGESFTVPIGGVPWEFLVVHKGSPGAAYGDGFGGGAVVAMSRHLYASRQWQVPAGSSYRDSAIHGWLNGAYMDLIDPEIRRGIRQVQIPYALGTAAQVGGSGLQTRVFLPSISELGRNFSATVIPILGSKLDYFDELATSPRRTALLSGALTDWWTRSSHATLTEAVHVTGVGGATWTTTEQYRGIRPAFVLDPKTHIQEG